MVNNSFKCYENVPGIIGVKTNIKDFFWGFGSCKEAVSPDVFDGCRIRVILEERPDKEVFGDIDLSAYTCHFRHFRAAPEQGTVLFDQTVKRMLPLRYVLSVSGNTVKMTVGKTYLKTIKTKLMYIHPVAYILFDTVSLLLLRNGMTTLYCSAVYLPDGTSAVFAAPPNTGKSLCALKMSKDFGARIVAEDMAVTDGTRLWGAPDTNLYRNYDDPSLKEFERQDSRSKLDTVDHLVILQKADGCGCDTPDDFDKKLLLINRYSLGYYYSPCLRALGYYNSEFSVLEAERTEERILKRLQSTAECVFIKNSDPMRFASQVAEWIKKS